MGFRIFCPVHKEEQLHRLSYNIGPKKGEKRQGRRGDAKMYFCIKCNKGYDVKITVTPLKTE